MSFFGAFWVFTSPRSIAGFFETEEDARKYARSCIAETIKPNSQNVGERGIQPRLGGKGALPIFTCCSIRQYDRTAIRLSFPTSRMLYQVAVFNNCRPVIYFSITSEVSAFRIPSWGACVELTALSAGSCRVESSPAAAR